ncbi:hypothetical protein BC7_00051 [Bacillus phage BC-7]|nr:hypothetical protein BC7_00051 [Bacillus phage BC-7]
MKFEKDVAQLVFTFKGGYTEETTVSHFFMNPDSIVRNIVYLHDNEAPFQGDNGLIYLDDMESFEIVNYDELLERHLARKPEEEDDSEEYRG